MNRRHDKRCERRLDQFAALLTHTKIFSEQRLRGGSTQANEHRRFDHIQFRLQPGPAGRCLAAVRLFVDAPLAHWLPLEMLHHVRDVNLVAVDAHFLQNFVQEFSRRTDKRPPRQIFIVPRLLAYEHHLRVRRAFAEDRLGAGLPERARPAAFRRCLQSLNRRPHRYQRRCR